MYPKLVPPSNMYLKQQQAKLLTENSLRIKCMIMFYNPIPILLEILQTVEKLDSKTYITNRRLNLGSDPITASTTLIINY